MKKSIFIIDDEQDIREILKINLESEGYDIKSFSSADDALKSFKSEKPDLIILDVMMEGKDGFEFCREIRANDRLKSIPVIFLSAKSEEFDKVLGLELGGDDYLTKPFSIKELRSRIKAVLRRTGDVPEIEKHTILRYKGVELNPEQYSLKVDSEEIKLTKTELNILCLFMENPGKIFSRDSIINSVRGHDVFVVDRTIDVHIMNLRKKLGDYKNIITTFSGVGYGFKE
jgi:DNA-binding response OmpR family regulator